ncbi:MAG TPA: CRISPR-associated protein Cas4 [Spirochaetota bacterium]|nr:CRISPR-associated protein Cas4 [Spirochaetota bacterium]HPJ43541.1 CRISPR-associated protein Cas4 [Spirochaetota bacterium]
MYSEEDYIQLSAIQHYVFCPRQCALIHVQGVWNENMFTAKGKIMHEKVDSGEDESRGEKQILRSLNIYSKRLGLSGRCDVVEMFGRGEDSTPYPVEYKSGKPKNDISDMAQLCAQSLCLEEMMNVAIRKAAIFYGKPRRRLEVDIDDDLRRSTEEIIKAIHNMISEKSIPSGKYESKCDSCSLHEACMPEVTSRKLNSYIEELYKEDEKTP